MLFPEAHKAMRSSISTLTLVSWGLTNAVEENDGRLDTWWTLGGVVCEGRFDLTLKVAKLGLLVLPDPSLRPVTAPSFLRLPSTVLLSTV